MARKSTNTIEKQILMLERQILKNKQKLSRLRHRVAPLVVEDFEFSMSSGKKIKLSRLFGKSDELVLIHNMGTRCSYCTLWADGFNGLWLHLANRSGFVVVSPDEPKIMGKFAKDRGWTFPIYSHHGTTFGKALGFESPTGSPWPGVSTLFKNPDGTMYRVASAFFGPGDDFCAAWHLFDLLPRGANGWQPKYSYKS